ncbi:MAG: 50S ribosomal protein L4 [Candidatus Peregrinibacteria bacterium]
MNAPLYTSTGEKNGEIVLPEAIFEVSVSMGLLHEALIRQHSNARIVTAKVLTRAEVKGGGRKPYKQKGTGRARQGSISAPHYRGGGVVFGPTGRENYEKEMPKKMRRKALFGSLSLKASDGKISVLQSFDEKLPKTKAFVGILEKIAPNQKVLLVIPQKDSIIEKSVSNIPGVKVVLSGYLNIADIMMYSTLLFLESGLQKTEEIFLS